MATGASVPYYTYLFLTPQLFAFVFENCRRLFDRYYCRHIAAETPGFDEHLAQETRVRLCQLDYLYHQILQVEQQALREQQPQMSSGGVSKVILHDVARPPCQRDDDPLRPFTLADHLRLLLEAFYYNASRVRDLLRDAGSALPGLSRFEAGGVRDVRHHLIEHPARHQGVKVMAVALGGPVGPQMKPLRWSGDSPGTVDQRLTANAREFCSSLESHLSAALESGAA